MRWLIVVLAMSACSGEIGDSGANADAGSVDASSAPDGSVAGCGDWDDCASPQRIALQVTGPGSALSNVPLLVVFTPERVSPMSLSPNSLRFVSEASGALRHEIDSVDADGTVRVWLRVPQVAADSVTTIFAYYGGPEDSPSGSVWSDEFRGVWHLGEDPESAAPQFADSTTAGNPGAGIGGVGTTSGVIGSAVVLDGINDFVRVAHDERLDISEQSITLSAWIRMDELQSVDTGVIIKVPENTTTQTEPNYHLGVQDENWGNFRVHTDNAADDLSYLNGSTVLAAGGWHYLSGVYDGSESRLYVDGVLEGTDPQSGTPTLNAADLVFGARGTDGTRFFEGAIDEVRIESVARSAEWIRFQYDSMRDQSITYGTPESRP